MSAIPADLPHASPAWRRALLGLAVVIGALLWVYRDTLSLMVGTWSRSDTFAHAFLVPPITLWLIWRRRAALALLQPAAEPWLLLPIALAALAWLLGDLVAVNAVTQLALVSLVVLSVPAVLGLRVAREIAFPLAFLFFCVPIGEFLLPVLMEATADFTIAALQMTGVPVYREGLRFVIPSGQWSVVEACSGVRYLIASFMVGTLFGYLNFRSNRKRLIFMLVSLVVPILANWLRAYMIVMIGHLSNNTLAVGVDHLVYGWVFFGVVISAMFLIGSRWGDPDAVDPAPPAPAATDKPRAAERTSTLVVGALLAVLLLPHGLLEALSRRDAAAQPPLLRLPDPLGTAAAAATPGSDWKPRFKGAAAEATRGYAAGTQTVGVHIAYYRGQTYQHKLVGSDNVLVDSMDKRWNHVEASAHDVPFEGRPLTLLKSELLSTGSLSQAGTQPALTVLQVYWVNGRFTSNDYWAKVQGGLQRLAGGGDDGAAVFLYTTGDPKTVGAPTLDAFATAHLGVIADLLQKTRAGR